MQAISKNTRTRHIKLTKKYKKRKETNHMPRLKCQKLHCAFYDKGRCEAKSITLNEEGVCETYEAGFTYYFYYCCEHMQANFLTYTEIDMHPEFKYSIYYMMKCLPVGFYNDDIRGMLIICDNRTKNPLNATDLLKLMVNELDKKALEDCVNDFIEKGLPQRQKLKEKIVNKVIEKDYGWLSPDGKFYPSEWGTHEQAAQKICRELINDSICPPCHDELIRRGWALIHNPSLVGNCLVTNQKPLTKKQRDFLYGYFKDMEMTSRAEFYQREDGSGMFPSRDAKN